jgi:hypothetical protein
MARFLATLPINLGFVNLETVQAYPTGGTGPTAYGPTTNFGSDPLPPRLGDSINNPVNLGNLTSIYRTINISNSHGGLSRQQSTFFSFKLITPRLVKLTQNYSQFSTTQNTNKNTLVSFYKIEDGNHRRELPINDQGYVIDEASVENGDQDNPNVWSDYPSTQLPKGEYIFLITNDIRYLETTYSISLECFIADWRFIAEVPEESLDFGSVTTGESSVLDLGLITS